MANLLVKTGTFTGNATARSITGIGFQPDLVLVKNVDTANDTYFKTKDMGTSQSFPHRADAGSDTSHITAIGTDGFSVGTDSSVNGSGNQIQYLCVKDNGSGCLQTFTFTGDGTDGKSVSLPSAWKPDYLFIKSDSGITGAEKFSYQSSADPFVAANAVSCVVYNGGSDRSDLISISGTTAGKLLLGNGSSSGGNLVNVSGVVHYGYAFRNTTNYFTVFTYVGNATNNRAITTTFQPSFVHLRRNDNGAPAFTFSTETVGYAQAFDGSKYTGAINAITSTGFTVGTAADGNNSGSTFYGFAIVDTSTISTPSINHADFLLNFI